MAKYIVEKLAMVKDFVIVQIVNLFLGNTPTARGIWISDVKFVWETFTMPMLWQNMNSGQVCCGKSCRKSWQWLKTMHLCK